MISRFVLSQIPRLAAGYANTSEEKLIALVPLVRQQGYLTRDQLFTVCRWKAPRAAARARNNSEEFVREITGFALSSSDERSRIEPLTLLGGVESPTASAILHWFHREPYPILDFRALWSLQLTETPPYSFTFWQSYVSGWRELFQQAQQQCAPVAITARQFDQALWQYSKDCQATNGPNP
jgi:hypothetical protein